MRALVIIWMAVAADAEPLPWQAFPEQLARLLTESGISQGSYEIWQQQHRTATRLRLDAGAAEHIAYFLLQTRSLGPDPPLEPVREARRYFDSLPTADRGVFLRGAEGDAALAPEVRRRISSFWSVPPVTERHTVLRELARKLGWTPERIISTAFRFLVQQTEGTDPDALYQQRGLSADPFPPTMAGVATGLAHIGRTDSVLLAGPGAELGSRFGVDDTKPVRSAQPQALWDLLRAKPKVFDCVEIRPEVVATLAGARCRATVGDLALDRLPAARYDLAVATNLLVYLNDQELALAIGNLAQALRPGGCLLHNDGRFAARLFGEAAGIPVIYFSSVKLGIQNGREQLDRIAVHCKPMQRP